MNRMTEYGEVFEFELERGEKFVGFGDSQQLAKILLAAQKEFPGVPFEDLEVYCTYEREFYLGPKRRP